MNTRGVTADLPPQRWSSATCAARSIRERVIQAAYALFTRYGARAVGVDAVIAAAPVAKMTRAARSGGHREGAAQWVDSDCVSLAWTSTW